MIPQRGGGIRVMLVDRYPIVLWGLENLIRMEGPTMQMVATATNCAGFAELVSKCVADVVVLDSSLLSKDRPDEILGLVNHHGNTKVLIWSGSQDNDLHDVAILHGACGVVRKEEPPETLLKAIRKVHEGQLWLDRCTTGRVFVELSRRKAQPPVDPVRRKLDSLTVREQEVVRTLVTKPGADNRKLADSLHIGEHTLRNHLSRIYDKLGVPNRLELYVLAHAHGLNGESRKSA